MDENKRLERPVPKKNGAGIHMDRAELKKRPATSSRPQTGSRPTGNRRPQTGSRPTGSSRPQTGSRPTGNRRPQTGSRPTGSRPTGSRPTTSSRPQTGSRPTTSSRPQTGSRPTQNRRRRRRRRNPIATFVPALILGLIMAFIVSAIIKGSLLKVKKTNNEYVLGTTFDIYNYVEPVNDKAYIEYDKTEFSPKEIGTYEIKYKVVRGKLKKRRKIKISVIDADIPLIEGPDEISFIIGEKCDFRDYYRVSDSEPNLAEKLKSSMDIDTSVTGTYNITLSVTDWYNNSSTKEIVVKVYDIEGEAVYAAKAVRAYKIAMGVETDAANIYVYAAEGGDAERYVLLNESLYEINADGTCSEYTYDFSDKSQIEIYQQLLIDIKEQGDIIPIEEVYGFR